MNKVKKIDFISIKSSVSGKLSVVNNLNDLPFEIKRIFWIYDVDENTIRGKHAHFKSSQVLVCLSGILEVQITYLNGESESFTLTSANTGLLIPPMVWHQMKFGKNTSVQVFASTLYDENDYIRDFDQFRAQYKL
jgi:dTDP-4-dehydrorhamnose 3,5-epimerase-like enzyme